MAPITELLAPARDFECGKAAIDCGADAVYIGAPRFGARSAAGNTIEDIAALARYAHIYWARVYVTMNTLLHDSEIPEAERLAWQLYDAGVDGIVIQDAGLLESRMPPLPLISSTQMHNHSPERVAFLEAAGFRRAILARELDLDQIRAIRAAAPNIELEAFIHGALCVCYSGQCYLSYALGARSGNRGECAQPCRKPYTLLDGDGAVLVRESHLLSIRDLNLTSRLAPLVDAGVTSFKIEGRLKDRTYVANIVAHYRAELDALGVRRSSSGTSKPNFTPDPSKTFNRGFTTYFLDGRTEPIASHDTPKMTGEPLGTMTARGLQSAVPLHPADGLCWFDSKGRLQGAPATEVGGIAAGTAVYRNRDYAFLETIRRAAPVRSIAVTFTLRATELEVRDEDGNTAACALGAGEPAKEAARAAETILRQLGKTGGTEFTCAAVEVAADPPPFLPASALNALRRELLERLRGIRETNRPRSQPAPMVNDVPYPERELSYLGNVLNRRAEAFYRRHGVVGIEPAAESGLDMAGRRLMTTRYCVKYELGWCPKEGVRRRPAEPLVLVDAEGRRLELHFDCRRCEMEVYPV
ncbi:MAG TPA: U32 family peptidase [Bryobacteraceae bacterium]|nr:U32 family peptidase [Bryobacteraceae bacterium]